VSIGAISMVERVGLVMNDRSGERNDRRKARGQAPSRRKKAGPMTFHSCST